MSFRVKIDAGKNAEPVYVQIKKALLDYARDRKFTHGTPMPSVKLIAAGAGVSLRTADHALCALIDDGYCFRRPKKGTFFAENGIAPRMVCGIFHDFSRPIESNNVAK